MNYTSTIEDFDKENFRKLLAPVVFLIILMIIGIPGNLTILIVYGRGFTKSVYKTIVWNLALADLTFCAVCIPFNVARVVHYYSFRGPWACILFVTLIYFLVMYSTHLLVVLSIHRFRKICMPLKSQITTQNVTYWVIVCLVIALVLSLPQTGLSKYEELNLGNNLTGHSCAIALSNPSIYSITFSYGFLTLFIFYTVVLIIIYCLIGRKLYLQHKKKIRKDDQDTAVQKLISSKLTKIAFTISIIFALSYIPVFVLQTTEKMIKQKDLTAVEFSVLRIVERLYVINHVANPFIYGAFDKQFRNQVRDIPKLRWQIPEKNASDVETTGTSLKQ